MSLSLLQNRSQRRDLNLFLPYNEMVGLLEQMIPYYSKRQDIEMASIISEKTDVYVEI